MTQFSVIVIFSAICMIVMIISVQSNLFLPKKSKFFFQLLFFILAVVNILFWISQVVNGDEKSFALHTIVTIFEYIIAPIIPVICLKAIGENKHFSKLLVPALLNIVLQIVSLFFGAVFRIDAYNVLHKGPFNLLFVALCLSSYVILLFSFYSFSKKYQFNNCVFISSALGIAGCAMIISQVFPHLKMSWSFISVAVVMLYVYYDQLVQQSDFTTQLMNRRSFECKAANLKRHSAILFFDVDHFKDINDSFGHVFGDTCLCKIGEYIKKSFEKYGYCCRYGGDEFCVIMTKNTKHAQELANQFLNKMRIDRERGELLPYVSVGCAEFNPGEEDVLDALKRADKSMYNMKRKNHSNTSL